MATNPQDLELSTFVSFDWHANELLGATFQTVARNLEDVLTTALIEARHNVAKGAGPSDHSGSGPGGHHTELHGFSWEDTGKLQQAIEIERSWTITANGNMVGAPNGALVVKPITVTDDEGNTRVVNYGAYLEIGFYPVLKRTLADGTVQERRGNFTRYPFLAPAMYMATEQFMSRMGISLTTELADMSKRARKQKAILERTPITPESTRRIARGVTMNAVQPVTDLEEREALNVQAQAQRRAERRAARQERKQRTQQPEKAPLTKEQQLEILRQKYQEFTSRKP